MAKGDKPVVRVTGKRMQKANQELPQYIDLCAFWASDDGGLRGSWDRSITGIVVKTRDGQEWDIDLHSGYFCNLRDEREGSQRAGRPAPNPVRRQRREEPPDFGDDPDPTNSYQGHDDDGVPF